MKAQHRGFRLQQATYNGHFYFDKLVQHLWFGKWAKYYIASYVSITLGLILAHIEPNV